MGAKTSADAAKPVVKARASVGGQDPLPGAGPRRSERNKPTQPPSKWELEEAARKLVKARLDRGKEYGASVQKQNRSPPPPRGAGIRSATPLQNSSFGSDLFSDESGANGSQSFGAGASPRLSDVSMSSMASSYMSEDAIPRPSPVPSPASSLAPSRAGAYPRLSVEPPRKGVSVAVQQSAETLRRAHLTTLRTRQQIEAQNATEQAQGEIERLRRENAAIEKRLSKQTSRLQNTVASLYRIGLPGQSAVGSGEEEPGAFQAMIDIQTLRAENQRMSAEFEDKRIGDISSILMSRTMSRLSLNEKELCYRLSLKQPDLDIRDKVSFAKVWTSLRKFMRCVRLGVKAEETRTCVIIKDTFERLRVACRNAKDLRNDKGEAGKAKRNAALMKYHFDFFERIADSAKAVQHVVASLYGDKRTKLTKAAFSSFARVCRKARRDSRKVGELQSKISLRVTPTVKSIFWQCWRRLVRVAALSDRFQRKQGKQILTRWHWKAQTQRRHGILYFRLVDSINSKSCKQILSSWRKRSQILGKCYTMYMKSLAKRGFNAFGISKTTETKPVLEAGTDSSLPDMAALRIAGSPSPGAIAMDISPTVCRPDFTQGTTPLVLDFHSREIEETRRGIMNHSAEYLASMYETYGIDYPANIHDLSQVLRYHVCEIGKRGDDPDRLELGIRADSHTFIARPDELQFMEEHIHFTGGIWHLSHWFGAAIITLILSRNTHEISIWEAPRPPAADSVAARLPVVQLPVVHPAAPVQASTASSIQAIQPANPIPDPVPGTPGSHVQAPAQASRATKVVARDKYGNPIATD